MEYIKHEADREYFEEDDEDYQERMKILFPDNKKKVKKVQRKKIPSVYFSCYDMGDIITIDQSKTKKSLIDEFISINKEDIESTEIQKSAPKYLKVWTKRGKVPELCVKLGLYNIE